MLDFESTTDLNVGAVLIYIDLNAVTTRELPNIHRLYSTSINW